MPGRNAARTAAVGLLLVALAAVLPQPGASAQAGCRAYPETGKTVCGRFLAYWDSHGGLAQQGYPISGEMQERSDTDGKAYTVQYFERAVFELHPENQPPYDVLLSLLGNFQYKAKYPTGAQGQRASTATGAVTFPETGHTVGGKFLDYWRSRGGLAQQGYPISDEFTEKSDLNGKNYTVQYFERAVFEMHPENQPPYDVLLSQLGTFRYKQKYLGTPTPVPNPTPGALPTPPGVTHAEVNDQVRRNGMMFTVFRVDVSAKGVAVNYKITNESAPTVSFILANADQKLLDATGRAFPQIEPDRRIPLVLKTGESYTVATGFSADMKTRHDKALLFTIDNVPGIGSVQVGIPLSD